MVNFRRVVTVLAVLALFTGMAFAQTENCSAQATNSTPLRAEGYTEQTGDIIINCVGGQPLAPGANIPLVNITVFYGPTVTSRLLSSTPNNANQFPSEALLLIDEPTTGVAANVGIAAGNVGYGATLPLIPCSTPFTGCMQSAGPVFTAGGGSFPTAVLPGTTNPAPNVYQGLTAGNSVTFYGVPALPPSTVGSRVYRITNVRINATQGGSAAGTTPVTAFITVSGPAALPISNAQPTVGFIQPGLSASVKGAKGFNQCETTPKTATGTTLTFTELFGTAFKTRVAAQSTVAGAGQIGNPQQSPLVPNQSTPGGIYNSESGFVYNGFNGSTAAGLADFGTRLKARFDNVPAGVRVFVNSANRAAPDAFPGGSAANANAASYVGYAVIVNGDGSGSDGTGFIPAGGTGAETSEVSIVAGTGTAVWEVVNTNPNTAETFSFGVFVSYTAATATNSPLPGSATVTLTYAPTSTSAVASSSLPVPRFNSGNTAFTGSVFTINVCRTVLLYPYITNQAGFDTGLTVANTSQDPFTTAAPTGAQNGACTFTYYGGTTIAPTTPPSPTNTGSIAAGTVWANTLGTIAPNFQGYAFAVCNFQFAHGFAFISDVGARNLAMGYLALIIPDVTPRDPSPFANGSKTGEQDAH